MTNDQRSILMNYFRIQLKKLANQDCGDNACLFAGRNKGGIRTNDGCRCFKDKCYDFIDEIGRVIK
jgi:hypothetical protein